ncbi:MAG: helix-turn-helix domain-containing protein [Acidimicrobiales bacterium]
MTDALEQRWREVGEFIRDQRRLGQLSLRKLADQAGVSNPYLSQIERGLRRPSAEILQQIAKALEISAETLFVRAGILDERVGSDDDLVEAISRDPTLTDDQRQTLAHIYRSFQAANGLHPESSVPDAEPEGGGGIGESSGDS